MSKKKKPSGNTIAQNKKATHDFTIESTYEAGLVLSGWEVKSIREGRVQLRDSYVLMKDAEAWLIGAHITPLKTTSTHVVADPTRTRKCLLHKAELSKLIGAIDRKGYTVVPLEMYWKNNKVKLKLGLAKGKKTHDKRAAIKEKDWNREKQRVLKTSKNLG